ncbi:MAG: RdgB/HAM1 family non-canonical purine NTP pyrophosphatase [Spirochaetales bacterium]|nr:RdgB/HAM1 family non-canonical purine NTP pyrophosphatase [Spirochaetales bacterium]
MEIILASNNQHKVREFGRIFTGVTVKSPRDAGITFECEESGTTFLENAVLKAESLFRLCRKPVISDDSGLCVPALNGEPGVYSARYGSDELKRELTDEEKYLYLLQKLEGTDNRKAFFVCCMVLYLDDYRFYVVQETVNGEIADTSKGEGGFGYDPVFLIPEWNKTVAELDDAKKDLISHRGKAGRRMLSLLKSERILDK